MSQSAKAVYFGTFRLPLNETSIASGNETIGEVLKFPPPGTAWSPKVDSR
jgi:hypothetical protein